MNETIRLIKNHRSIRKYTDKEIDRSILEEVVRAGQAASSSSYVQAYSVVRVKAEDKRQKLYEWTGQQKNVLSAPEFLIFCADLNKIAKQAGSHMNYSYTEWLLIASVDVSLVAQNVMIAAESLGLGGVYVGAIRNEIEKVSTMLELPEGVMPIFGMCLGWPDQNPDCKPRMPLDLVMFDEVYQNDQCFDSYDQEVKDYYIKRTKGKIDYTWSEQMALKSKGENRPHILSYLHKQGLARK